MAREQSPSITSHTINLSTIGDIDIGRNIFKSFDFTKQRPKTGERSKKL